MGAASRPPRWCQGKTLYGRKTGGEADEAAAILRVHYRPRECGWGAAARFAALNFVPRLSLPVFTGAVVARLFRNEYELATGEFIVINTATLAAIHFAQELTSGEAGGGSLCPKEKVSGASGDPRTESERASESRKTERKGKEDSNGERKSAEGEAERAPPPGDAWGALSRFWRPPSALTRTGSLLLLLLIASPFLHDLTQAVADDTAVLVAAACYGVHLGTADFTAAATDDFTCLEPLPLSSALIGSVVLASRVSRPSSVFAFLTFAAQLFGRGPGAVTALFQKSRHSRLAAATLAAVPLIVVFAIRSSTPPLPRWAVFAFCAVWVYIVVVVPTIYCAWVQPRRIDRGGPWDIPAEIAD